MKLFRVFMAAGFAAALTDGASSTVAKPMVYFDAFPSFGIAYLVDWQPKKRARVVAQPGASTGRYVDDGTQRVITLDAPLESTLSNGADACGNYAYVQQIQKLVIRDLIGETRVVEMGQDLYRGGCYDGQTSPFGSVDDPGISTRRMPMDARPPMSDIVPGVELAGPSEAAWPSIPNLWPAQAVVSIQSSSVVFKATGHSFPSNFSPDGWWVMNLPGQQRAQTRLQLDAKTGGETWLIADWANGLAQRVVALNFVKTTPDAGFGTMKQAARMWQYGGSVGTRTPFFHYLYTNGTGERVQKNLDAGTESRTQIPQWGLEGADLWEKWDYPDELRVLTRRWTPVNNHGTKVHWVIERFDAMVDDVPMVLMPARVNHLVDTGKASAPTSASTKVRQASPDFDLPRRPR